MSDEPGSAPAGDAVSSSLTVAEYRAQAAAICKSANERNDHMPEGGLAESVEFAENTARIACDALERLKPPPELAQSHAEAVGLTRALLEGFPPLVVAAKAGIVAFVSASSERAESNTKLGDQLIELWKKLGVPACYEPHD